MGGTPGSSLVSRGYWFMACVLLLLVGCGESEGVAEGAVVAAYVAAPLCAEAEGGPAGEARVRVVCLDPVERGGRLDLAQVGANARRATEDVTAIAYVEQQGPAGRFSEPVVDSAGIAWIHASSGAKAIQRVLDAVEESDSGSLRSSVRESLGGGSKEGRATLPTADPRAPRPIPGA